MNLKSTEYVYLTHSFRIALYQRNVEEIFVLQFFNKKFELLCLAVGTVMCICDSYLADILLGKLLFFFQIRNLSIVIHVDYLSVFDFFLLFPLFGEL